MKTMITEGESELRSSLEEHEYVIMEIVGKENAIKNDQNLHKETEKDLKLIELKNKKLYEQLNDIINNQQRKEKHSVTT